MNSWTNVTITDHFDLDNQLRLEIKKLKTELEFVTNERDNYYKELTNIFEALKEYGYIDLTYGKETMKVISPDSYEVTSKS